MIDVKIIEENKKDFLDLLLIADEQEDMIDKYLERGTLFALYDGDLRSLCVVTDEGGGTFELQNLATYEKYRKMGYGRYLINHVCRYFAGAGRTMLVGTGDSPLTLPFYLASGFSYSHRIEGYFAKHYANPIIEDGVLIKDKVYLIRQIGV